MKSLLNGPISADELIKIIISESDRSLQLEDAIILLLYCTQTVTAKEISEKLNLSDRYRNMILQRLEDKLLITRRINKTNQIVFLTKNGIKHVEKKRSY